MEDKKDRQTITECLSCIERELEDTLKTISHLVDMVANLKTVVLQQEKEYNIYNRRE
ncbi:hypothetical protein KBG31_03310 [Patescibacteria group bacterium]|nr:hypothetical protein [Patescibacteria group bacterium]